MVCIAELLTQLAWEYRTAVSSSTKATFARAAEKPPHLEWGDRVCRQGVPVQRSSGGSAKKGSVDVCTGGSWRSRCTLTFTERSTLHGNNKSISGIDRCGQKRSHVIDSMTEIDASTPSRARPESSRIVLVRSASVSGAPTKFISTAHEDQNWVVGGPGQRGHGNGAARFRRTDHLRLVGLPSLRRSSTWAASNSPPCHRPATRRRRRVRSRKDAG